MSGWQMENRPTVQNVERPWQPSSWRGKGLTYQQPRWGDAAEAERARKQLSASLPLVFAGECRTLTERLAAVQRGEAFVLQAGDCAESFNTSPNSICDTLRVILQMALVMTYAGGVPVVKIGRIAGQYAKPRSNTTETRDGIELPSFMGHMINDVGFSQSERTPDPSRMLTAYERAASTLNMVRALTSGGYAHLNRAAAWNREFVASSPAGKQYSRLVQEIDKSLRFVQACGIATEDAPELSSVEFYSSHEALVLDYEEPLTRIDSTTGDWYDCSAHMVWIGTRSLKPCYEGHLEFMRGIGNPIACKVGVKDTTERVLDLCDQLNPDKIPGRLTLITRMGADCVSDALPPIIEAVEASGHPVVWMCDPMHGNTYLLPSGLKTRSFETVAEELEAYFLTHQECGTWPGGVHLELTGDMVTECVGGSDDVTDDELFTSFETLCDPRLNGTQALDMAFRMADML